MLKPAVWLSMTDFAHLSGWVQPWESAGFQLIASPTPPTKAVAFFSVAEEIDNPHVPGDPFRLQMTTDSSLVFPTWQKPPAMCPTLRVPIIQAESLFLLLAPLLFERIGLVAASLTDPLTGLPNRRSWETELARRWATSTPNASEVLCLALLDIDHFKQFNDRLGPAAGDAALTSCAATLLASLSPTDFLCRLGGDGFALLLTLPHTSALPTLDHIRHSICPALTCSAGYSLSPTHTSPHSLYASASRALAQAKALGRNKTVGA